MAAPALELRDVRVRLGTVQALDGATLVARDGSVHALLGENGAGKTTLMRIAYGMIRPASGSIIVRGTPLRAGMPTDAIRAGIGMVHQHFTLVPTMTVAANVALGGGPWRWNADATAERIRMIGDETGLRLQPEMLVAMLDIAGQQRLEIVKALARDARILILDEPTAVLSPRQSEELLRWLRQAADAGRTIILITHKLRDALAVSDEITVLRHGRSVLHARTRDTSPQQLAGAMLGGSMVTRGAAGIAAPQSAGTGGRTGPRASAPGVPVISAHEIAITDARSVARIRNATLEVRAGEIVGIAAVEGSGHRALLRALAGRLAVFHGSLTLPSTVGFVPEDRHRAALALDLDLVENVALHGAGARRGLVPWPGIARRTRELLRAFDVRAPHERVRARTLSGGNQQKLVLARELDGQPQALVAENPTRGLDLRAMEAVHGRLHAARMAGMAIVLHSSDVDEILALADRVLVVFEGAVREVSPDRAVVGAAMVGLA